MKNIIAQNANPTNPNNLQGADSQPLGLYELATHPNLINIICEVHDMEFVIDWSFYEAFTKAKKKIAVMTQEACELYIEWDTFEFGRIMENPSLDQINFRKLVLSIVIMLSFEIINTVIIDRYI